MISMNTSMKVTDQTGYSTEIVTPPKRIISLVPSQSELLWDLGLKKELIGITKFCIHPNEMFESVERIGGTKQLNLEKIKSLKPDLIIGNKEENEKAQIQELRNEFPVWMSDIYNLDDALEMILQIGNITGKENESISIHNNIQKEFKALNNQNLIGKTVAYLMWFNPIMAAASQTFINDMLEKCGLINVFQDKNRYPVITEEDMLKTKPDFVFISSEPFPFSEKHIKLFQRLIPDTKVILVDGEMFTWYGSRLALSAKYFGNILKTK